MFYDNIWKERVPFVEFLNKQGALISCKSNVPMGLMTMETNPNIFGSCSNPHNKGRTSGGSSGGDGCCVSLGLVSSGIGSDIAGSLRIPSLFCGICCLKPTYGRFTSQVNTMPWEFKAWD